MGSRPLSTDSKGENMDTEKVTQELQRRFSAPLPEYYRRRILFWQDPDRAFEAAIDDISLPDVKILKLTGSNNFEAKMLLTETDTKSNYLVYNPVSYRDIREDWLLDIELYSEEFRADLLSMRMQALKMQETPPLRKAMREYGKFFDSKERTAKLQALHNTYTTPGQLHIDILSVLTGAESNTAPSVIQALLSAGLEGEENKKLQAVKKFGSEAALWGMIGQYTGYAHDGGTSLLPLACHVFLTALSATMAEKDMKEFDDWISPHHQQYCYSLIHEWLHTEQDEAAYEVARAVEQERRLPAFFDRMEIGALLDSECFPCINESILRRYMTDIGENAIHADDIAKTVEKRRTQKWYRRVQNYFDGLLQTAQMQKFYQEHIGGFHFAEAGKLWRAYCDDLCKMDHYYRQFHAAFGKGLKQSTTELDDLYKNVAEYAEKLYKNWYLETLGSQWTSLIAEEMEQEGCLSEIPQQTSFYTSFVSRLAANGRVFVILSDALRYEVAVELTGQLIRETRGAAKITGVQSIFPSVTKFGMAALLPHRKLQLTKDGQVLCDGAPTDGLANREKLLKSVGGTAIGYKELIALRQAERRERLSGANVIYIYHNVIDAVGDKALTEDQVFDACEQAILEIKNLVRLIMNDLNGTNILITADHGFLYSYKPLEESDKAERSFVSGTVRELERRYVLAAGDCAAEHMLKIPLKGLNTMLTGFTPMNGIRMKISGGGMNYVHGGVSLQECVVPVIEFRNQRTGQNQSGRKTELQLLSQSRRISNSIFSLDFYQKEPVGGKISPAIYEVYLADQAGNAVSDKSTVIADKTSNNGAERMFRARFTLKSMEFQKTDSYYLVIRDKETGNISDQTAFEINVVFANDFDF